MYPFLHVRKIIMFLIILIFGPKTLSFEHAAIAFWHTRRGILLDSVWTRLQSSSKLFGALSKRTSLFLSDAHKFLVFQPIFYYFRSVLRISILLECNSFFYASAFIHKIRQVCIQIQRYCSFFVVLLILTKESTFHQG